MKSINLSRQYMVMLIIALFFMGCSKNDDSADPVDMPDSSKVTSVVLEAVTDFAGPCPKDFNFDGEISVDGPLTVKYTWLRSDGATSPEQTLVFTTAGTRTVSTSWTFGESGESYMDYWQQLKIIDPQEMLSNKAEFSLECDPDNYVKITSLTPESPAVMFAGQDVTFSFDYQTIEAGGVRIFGRPFTNGSLTPNYAAHPSPLHPSGNGTGTGSFTINGNDTVDQIRLQMWNADQTELLYEDFVDVDYDFIAHHVEMTSITPESPAEIFAGQDVTFTFDYHTIEASGVRIFGRPFTNGSLTPNYAAHASPIHPSGSGNSTGSFTINGNASVDQIRFQMWNADQTELLYEVFVDVQYEFIAHQVELTSITPESPAEMFAGQDVEFSFDYYTIESGGVRIFGRPFTNGSLTPNYAAHPSPLHPSGNGTGTGSFTINGNAAVDQIRFQMWNADQTELLYEVFVDVQYEFIAHQVEMTSITPESPAVMSAGQLVEFNFDYYTIESGGVRIFGRPFTNGSLTPNYSAHGSPLHPSGNGSATGSFTINGNAVVDQIRFQMWNADQTVLLFEVFVSVNYSFE